MIPAFASEIESIHTQLAGTFHALEVAWQDAVERSFKRTYIDDINKTVDSSLLGGNIHDIMGIKDLLIRLDQLTQKMSSLSEMRFDTVLTDRSGRKRSAPSRYTNAEVYNLYQEGNPQNHWRQKMTWEEIKGINKART